MNTKVTRMTVSAVMLALATVLALVCAEIPFLNLPFGGGFTIASMLPIVLVSYLYGLKQGFFVSTLYAVIQLMLGALTGGGYVLSLFAVDSDNYMGVWAGCGIILLDYLVAYTVIGIGGIFRNRCRPVPALVLGSGLALLCRYLVHILSGTIFFSTYATWFFSQEGFYAIGQQILSHFSGFGLSLIYAVFYNGLFMIPEIIVTMLAASVIAPLPMIKNAKAD